MKRRALLLGGAAALAAGCGGGGGGSKPGRAVFTVAWPEKDTRLIPRASQSVVIELRQGASVVARQIIPRPSSNSATFDSLAEGDYIALATAYPSTDGTGIAQASGTVSLTIRDGETTQVPLTMNSTIASFGLSYSTLGVGETRRILAVPKDASGATVLAVNSFLEMVVTEGAGNITWDSGWFLATGRANGTVTFRITDLDSGISSTASLQIGPLAPPHPNPVTIPARGPFAVDSVHYVVWQAVPSTIYLGKSQFLAAIDPDSGLQIRSLSLNQNPSSAAPNYPTVNRIVLSADCQKIYYMTSPGIRVINVVPGAFFNTSSHFSTTGFFLEYITPGPEYLPVVSFAPPINVNSLSHAILNSSGSIINSFSAHFSGISYDRRLLYTRKSGANEARLQMVHRIDPVLGFVFEKDADTEPVNYARDGYAYSYSGTTSRKIYDANTLVQVGTLDSNSGPYPRYYADNQVDEFVYSVVEQAGGSRPGIVKHGGVPLRTLSTVDCPVDVLSNFLEIQIQALGQNRVVIMDPVVAVGYVLRVCTGS